MSKGERKPKRWRALAEIIPPALTGATEPHATYEMKVQPLTIALGDDPLRIITRMHWERTGETSESLRIGPSYTFGCVTYSITNQQWQASDYVMDEVSYHTTRTRAQSALVARARKVFEYV